jgi:glutamate dehydrogenase
MAIALAPRVYGLDAICAAALQTGAGEEAATFVRRVFGRVADKDLAAAPADQRAAAACPPRPRPPARGVPGPQFNATPPTTPSSRHTIVQIVNDDMLLLVIDQQRFNR